MMRQLRHLYDSIQSLMNAPLLFPEQQSSRYKLETRQRLESLDESRVSLGRLGDIVGELPPGPGHFEVG